MTHIIPENCEVWMGFNDTLNATLALEAITPITLARDYKFQVIDLGTDKINHWRCWRFVITGRKGFKRYTRTIDDMHNAVNDFKAGYMYAQREVK